MKKRGKNGGEEIPLILESYEDIFSDFDPRDYSQRALSGDFLNECRKASADKNGEIVLKLYVPKGRRNLVAESKIKKRLKEHFSKHHLKLEKKLRRIFFEGLAWFLAGSAAIIFTAIFLNHSSDDFFIKFLIALGHPAGWFFMWEGLGKMLILIKEKSSMRDFNKKMRNAKIYFLGK